MRERGFGYIEAAFIAAIVIGLIAGARWMYALGSNAKQAEWDQKKLQDVKFAIARDQDVSDAIKEGEDRRQLAQHRADKQATNFQEAIREARRIGTPLAVSELPGPDQAPVAAAGGVGGQSSPQGLRAPALRDPGGGVRLTWQFVREFDGGWTGLDGESVSRLALGDTGPFRASAASPYGLVDLSGVAVENAARCSRDRRELGTLMRKIEDAAVAWDKRKSP